MLTTREISGFMADVLTAESEALLADVVSDLPQKVELVYVDYRECLDGGQIASLFVDGDPGGYFDEWLSDAEWHGLSYELDNVQKDHGLTDREMDLIRDDLEEILRERDASTPLSDLIAATPSQWMRYWIDERDLDTDELLDRISIGVNGVGEVLDALGLLGTDQQTPELEEQIANVLANAGTEVAIFVLWHGPIDDLVEACAWDYGKDAPRQTITWENPYLLLYHPFLGNGWADKIDCTITVPFEKQHLHLDTREGGGGYSFTDEVCGGWVSDDSTNVTIHREDAR